MGRPPPIGPVVRKTITLPLALWERISAHRHDNRISSEADAVRQVLQAGLDAEEQRLARTDPK